MIDDLTLNPDKPIENKDRTPDGRALVLGQVNAAKSECLRLSVKAANAKDVPTMDFWIRAARQLERVIEDLNG